MPLIKIVATGGTIAAPSGGQEIKIQDPNAAGSNSSDASSVNAPARSVGNAALARRIGGPI